MNLLKPGVVIDNNDPALLNRVRVNFDTETNSSVFSAIPDTYRGKPTKLNGDLVEEFKWTEIDLFVCHPLLPIFLKTTPKIHESVNIIRVNDDYRFDQQYYIPAPVSSTRGVYQENSKIQRSYIGKDRYYTPKLLKKPGTDEYYNPKEKGVFPDSSYTAFLSRGTSDIVMSDGDVVIRSGKTKTLPTKRNQDLPFNNDRAFIQLSHFRNNIEPISNITEKTIINKKILGIKTLFEWSILNPENQMNVFQYTLTLYQLPDNKYKTNIGKDIIIPNNDKFIISNITKQGGIEDVINDVLKFIKGINLGIINISGFPIVNVSNQFPCYIKPSDSTYSYIRNNKPQNETIEFKNITTISKGISYKKSLNDNSSTEKLNNGISDGIGFIYSQNNTTEPISIQKISQSDINISNEDTTYLLTAAYNTFLLSNKSQIPGKPRIVLDQNGAMGISHQDIIDKILPATEPMVRGDKLMELLNLIVRFMLFHVHPYPGLPPVKISTDGVESSEILNKMLNANNTILNKYIRIN